MKDAGEKMRAEARDAIESGTYLEYLERQNQRLGDVLLEIMGSSRAALGMDASYERVFGRAEDVLRDNNPKSNHGF